MAVALEAAVSYCRTGPDSDVYVYGTREGYTCHVANNRGTRVNFIRLFASPAWKYMPKPLRWAIVRLDFSRLNTVPLKNTMAGNTYHSDDVQGMIDGLRLLRISGLKVPQSAIDRLKKERDG
jgi:hypothetical protein